MHKILAAALVVAPLLAGGPPTFPIPNDYSNSIAPRWLAKPVLASRLVDGMESLNTWQAKNTDQAKGTIELTTERKVEGTQALRLRSRTVGDTPLPNGRYFGFASAVRAVNNEDWSGSNRLSFWVYPELPGFRVVSLLVIFHNEGTTKVPDVYGKMGLNYLILRNHEWNHVVWEIGNLARDKVTSVEFQYRLQGNEPGASEQVAFDFDKLELQTVKEDHWEGWNVAPGEISYPHSGYPAGAPKSAIAGGLAAREFQLVNSETGQVVLSKALAQVRSKIGTFQVMDFSEVRQPGSYLIRAGAAATRPFRIADDVWTSSLWKALNFFYTERCGYAIPGVHDICHRDWMMTRGDKKIPINGGWHDAGDLSQSFSNTAEATYAMFHLAERLGQSGQEPALRQRLLEEAVWGLDWVLKTSFGDGYRASFSTMDRWTNNIVGDFDDMAAQPRNSASANYSAAATEALAARVLRPTDPTLAGYALKKAIEDWGFAVAAPENPREGGLTTWAHGVQAGVELYAATGEAKYREKAVELARQVMASQRKGFLPGVTEPLAGVFYTGPDQKRVFRAEHNSQESIPVAALVRLCEAFPEHSEWINWYSAVTLYSDYYQKAMSAYTQPYGMLPNSVYFEEEAKGLRAGRGANPEAFLEQVRNGVKVGEGAYVRLFPVWFEFRGNHGTVLTQAKALSAAAQLRGSLGLSHLVEQQLEWVLGRNPFVQSTMWGEGHDYAPQYSAMSGDLVGSLPVGIQTRENRDIPYWPTENCHNWKEIWVVPVSRWLWILRDLAGPAVVEGLASGAPLELVHAATGQRLPIAVDAASGRFRAEAPEGEYELVQGSSKRAVTLLPAGHYSLDLREGRQLDVRLTQQTTADGKVTLTATVSGAGRHTLALRADNFKAVPAERVVELKAGVAQTITWQAQLATNDAPWVAVVVPDNDLSQRREATGSTRTR